MNGYIHISHSPPKRAGYIKRERARRRAGNSGLCQRERRIHKRGDPDCGCRR